MNKNDSQPESGASNALMAWYIIGLIAIALLVIDGGSVRRTRRASQSAADSGALAGVQYLSNTDSPSEEDLLATINETVESHGVADTDGESANEVNRNVNAFYMAENGGRIIGCNKVGTCGSVPPLARGIEVVVVKDVNAFIAGLMGIRTLGVKADSQAAF